MKVEICGTGCAKCHATVANIRRAVQEMGLEKEVEVVEVKDIVEISNKGVFMTPAVVIDGDKVVGGRVPGLEEIKNWIKGSR